MMLSSLSVSIFRTGLGSILFAIGIDNSELNTIKPATGLDVILNTPSSAYAPRNDAEPMPVIAGETSASSPQGRYAKGPFTLTHTSIPWHYIKF